MREFRISKHLRAIAMNPATRIDAGQRIRQTERHHSSEYQIVANRRWVLWECNDYDRFARAVSALLAQRAAVRARKPSSGMVLRNCSFELCGRPFWVFRSHLRQQTCSRACRTRLQFARMSPSEKKERAQRISTGIAECRRPENTPRREALKRLIERMVAA